MSSSEETEELLGTRAVVVSVSVAQNPLGGWDDERALLPLLPGFWPLR